MANVSSASLRNREVFYLLPGEAGEHQNLLVWPLDRCPIADQPFELIPLSFGYGASDGPSLPSIVRAALISLAIVFGLAASRLPFRNFKANQAAEF